MKKLVLTLCLCLAMGAAWVVAGQAADGKALYSKCEGCHGADGSKVALGVGVPLKGLSADALGKALLGYKAKTFGGAKKAVMESAAARLSDEEITALAQYISKL